MNIDQIIKALNSKGVLLTNLSQIEDGKLFSVIVRKKGTTATGYGSDATVEGAVRKALSLIRDSFDTKGDNGSKFNKPVKGIYSPDAVKEPAPKRKRKRL